MSVYLERFGKVKTPCGDCIDGECTMNCGGVELADFESRPTDFVGIATPTVIYIGVRDRAQFDKIASPLEDRGETENGHVLIKQVGEFGKGVTVIFQHWVKSLTYTGRLRLQERTDAVEGISISHVEREMAKP
jgi:hypothetical protein